MLNQKVEEKEKADIREIKKMIDNTKKLINLYNERSLRIDSDIRDMIDQKITIQQDTLDNERTKNEVKKEMEDLEKALLEAKNSLEVGTIKDKEITKEVIRKFSILIFRINKNF